MSGSKNTFPSILRMFDIFWWLYRSRWLSTRLHFSTRVSYRLSWRSFIFWSKPPSTTIRRWLATFCRIATEATDIIKNEYCRTANKKSLEKHTRSLFAYKVIFSFDPFMYLFSSSTDGIIFIWRMDNFSKVSRTSLFAVIIPRLVSSCREQCRPFSECL